ncbi:translocation/assembly module TamB domain-containing protein [Thiobacillus denitrificans]|uniref:translocation/assembly module TamB domain-containing protein n=1 Tax=Thiobacillus denitrificans TaxID=36861 RepID=UPI0003655574|nr:translocation/assembly module TamB domain-containing protein [Thiobacillus denitrificans]
MRRAIRWLAGLFALLGLLVAAGAFLAGTATGFRWLSGAAANLSGGRVQIEGVDGHLGVPLGIRKLTIATAARRIEIEGIRLEWQPRALWQRRLDVDLLAARNVRVTILKPDPTPLQLPRSLRLPLAVQVRTFDLAQLEIVDAGAGLTLGALRGRLDDDGQRYRLTQASVSSPWAGLQGQVEIGKDAPFVLQGRIDAVRDEPVPITARLGLTGTLTALQFRLDAEAESMRMMASGEAAPFARVRLPRLLLSGQGIDPRLFVTDAPAADLAFSGVFEGRVGERLLGSFSLTNRLAGRLDQHRLPVANLTGALAGDMTDADFSALAIDLGAAGQLTGTGQWHNGRFALDLASPRLDLAGLHRDLYATRLRTTLQLTGDAARQALDAEVDETWGQGRFTLSHADSRLRLETANFSGQAGRLTAKGMLQLDASRAFSAEFDATQINPARFGQFPRARLNARGQVSGALLPGLRMQTQFTLPPGELEGRPVRGQGRLRYENRHLTGADIDLDIAGNRAQLTGAYGRAGDRLKWDIDAPALARLNLGLAGRLTSTGSAGGDPAQLQIDAKVAASGLRLPGDIAADSLDLQLELQATAAGAFNGRLDARGVRLAGQRLSVIQADLQGRRNAHTLSLDARLPAWRVTANLAGGLDATRMSWRGQLNRAEVEGAWPMRLSAPAALTLSRERQQVNDLVLTLAGGQVNVMQIDRQGAQLATRGSLANLPLTPVLGLLEKPLPFTTDLRMNGDWSLRLGDTLDGQARLLRQSGDVHLTEPAMNLGLTALALNFRADASRVTARLEADTREAGQVRAEGRATLERTGAAFGLPRSAPLAWTATLNVPDLRLARPFLPVGIQLDARLATQLAGSGSLAAPRIDGQIDAGAIRFAMPEEGIAITDGSLKLLLDGDRVRVQQGELKGQSGRIVVSGEAQLKNPQAGLTLVFEKFAAINRSDRRVSVSGTTRLNLDPQRLQLTGELTADRARLEMPEAGRPVLSSDVVVIGQPPREKPVAQRFPLALDLTLRLGDDFLFKGGGLDARLGGQLRVFTVSRTLRPDPPQNEHPDGRKPQAAYPSQVLRGEGTIQVEEGRYAAYAQTLEIERGVLRFAGPIDNPGLDVLAVRKNPSVKAGVQVSGTVQRPVVKLYSDPALPDTEKLAWLVLGHGLENSGQQEFVLLQVAAGALLSQAESVNFQSKLADALGIDSFDVRAGSGDDLTGSVVSVGKRLSSRAMLSYEQSLDGLSQVVKVLYQLTPRVRLEAQAGQQSSFDAFYSLEYD